MSFEDQVEEVRQSMPSSDEWFKPKEGSNRMRIAVEPVINTWRYKYGICYEGCGYCDKKQLEADGANVTVRFLTYIIDRDDGNQLKLYQMPYKVAKQLIEFKRDDEDGYGFEEFPMPYDVNIKTENPGTKEVIYTVMPAKNETELTEAEKEVIEEQKPVEEIIESMKKKQQEKMEGGEQSTDEAVREAQDKARQDAEAEGISPEDSPF